MIKDNQKTFNRLHILMDACIIIISYLLTYYLRFYILLKFIPFFKLSENERFYSVQKYSENLLLIVPLYLILYFFTHLYTPKRSRRRVSEAYNILVANIFGIAMLASFLYFIGESHISRKFLGLYFLTNISLTLLSRILSMQFKIFSAQATTLSMFYMVGYGKFAEAYIDRIF